MKGIIGINMGMNHKIFAIIAGVILVIIIVILVVLVMVASTNPKENLTFDNNAYNIVATNQPEQNTTENKVSNEPENTTGNNQKEKGEIVEVETEDGGKIPVPSKFEYKEGTIDTGAVIADKDGNEFVWVPVNDYNDYQRQMFLHNGENGDTETTLEEANIRDTNDYNKDFNDSIRNYRGFYIARYEAGKEKDKIVSKRGALVWTGVSWKNARDLSIGMYEENNCFQTDLVNSYAWDTTCNWFRNTGTNIDDSTDYGNYNNNSNSQKKVVKAGSNENWKVNNIYDMAGNAWEYTTEEFGEHERYHMGRGGGYWNEGQVYPISSRGSSDDGANLTIGFRVVMYLK